YFFWLMGIFLDVLNEITPGPDLGSDVEKLRHYRQQEVTIAKQIPEMSVVTFTVFMFALDAGEFCAQNQHSPDQRNHPDDQIWLHHPQGFRAQVRVIDTLELARRHLLRRQFHTRKNEDRSDQDTGNTAQRIERLGEIQPPFRTVGVSQLRNKRVGGGFKKRKTAGDHKQRQQKELIPPGQGGRPKQESAQRVQDQPGDKARLIAGPSHQQGRGHGQQEIAHVEGG